MAAVSTAQVNALRTIAGQAVYVTNKGQTDVKGVTAQTFAALRRAGLATVNGASRSTVKSRSARRAVLTPAGKAALKA
jgi:hypothetical protein